MLDRGCIWAFDFDEDGTWHLFGAHQEEPLRSGKYVAKGAYYTELTHDNPDFSQVPVTYIWNYDGQQLTFVELWGEDVIEDRREIYDGQTYTRVDE